MTDRKPTEQRGGTPPGDAEAKAKGDWSAHAQDGVVPAELGGSDAPRGVLDDDPELGSDVLGGAADDEPATADGIDLAAGDNADAVTDGGPKPDGPEPDLRDAASGPRQADVESAER